jgi:hypothetical protein
VPTSASRANALESTLIPATYPDPLEDRTTREPEWEPIPPSPGHEHPMRTYEWNNINDEVRVEGPIFAKPLTKRQRQEKPVP